MGWFFSIEAPSTRACTVFTFPFDGSGAAAVSPLCRFDGIVPDSRRPRPSTRKLEELADGHVLARSFRCVAAKAEAATVGVGCQKEEAGGLLTRLSAPSKRVAVSVRSLSIAYTGAAGGSSRVGGEK